MQRSITPLEFFLKLLSSAQPCPPLCSSTEPSTAVFSLNQRQHFAQPWAWAVVCNMQRDSHGHPVPYLLREILVEVKHVFCSIIQCNRYVWKFNILFDFVILIFSFIIMYKREKKYGGLFSQSSSYIYQTGSGLEVFTWQMAKSRRSILCSKCLYGAMGYKKCLGPEKSYWASVLLSSPIWGLLKKDNCFHVCFSSQFSF